MGTTLTLTSKWVREWSNNRYHTAKFFPLDEFEGVTGFTSVYAFSQEDAKTMEKNQTVAGCSNFKVWTDAFIMDIDDGGVSLPGVLERLKVLGLAHEVWLSGYKGHHVVVPCKPMSGLDVPYTQRKFAETFEGDIDLSLYRHNSLIRLPGTLHRKSTADKELRKTLVGRHPGKRLVFNKQVRDPARDKVFSLEEGMFPDSWLEAGITRYQRLIGNSPGRGNRFTTLWSVAKALVQSGLSHDTILEMMGAVNATWGEDEHEESEVVRAVKEAFK